jgi:hypothetical protein
MRLVAGLSPRRPGFPPESTHVGNVVDKVAVGQIFLQVIPVFACQYHSTGVVHTHMIRGDEQKSRCNKHLPVDFKGLSNVQINDGTNIYTPYTLSLAPQPSLGLGPLHNIVTYSGVLFTMELHCTPKFNTQLLIIISSTPNTPGATSL